MKGWSTLTALRNGKIVKMNHKHGDRLLTMGTDENGRDILVEKCRKEWVISCVDFNALMDAQCQVTEDFDITFEEAIRAMLDGKIVACEHLPNRVFKFDKKFMWGSLWDNHSKKWVNMSTLSPVEQECMWRVVE